MRSTKKCTIYKNNSTRKHASNLLQSTARVSSLPEPAATPGDNSVQITKSELIMRFCIYEIDTPAGHLTGCLFADGTNTTGVLNPKPGKLPTLQAMLSTLFQHSLKHNYATIDVCGHFTTNDGVLHDAQAELLSYARDYHANQLLKRFASRK